MGVHQMAILDVAALMLRHLVADKLMKSPDLNPRFSWVTVLIIIADKRETIPVIKNPDSDNVAP